MDARCRIEMLGRLRVQQGERVITRFSTQKTGALLGYLAYYRERAHPAEMLIELLWPGATARPRCFDSSGWRLVRTAEGAHIPKELEDSSIGTGPRGK